MRFRTILSAVLSVSALGAHAQSVERVGVAAWVKDNAQAELARGDVETLFIGYDIRQGERIRTDPSGEAQLVFMDGSSVTVGHHASLVVDDFTYDRESRKGHLGLAMAKGILRFIGGHLSKDGSVEVRTPNAVLGIRGAIVFIEVVPESGTTTATLIFGDRLTITGSSGSVQEIRRIGLSSRIARDGIPSSPQRIEPALLFQFERALEQRPGNTAPVEQIAFQVTTNNAPPLPPGQAPPSALPTLGVVAGGGTTLPTLGVVAGGGTTRLVGVGAGADGPWIPPAGAQFVSSSGVLAGLKIQPGGFVLLGNGPPDLPLPQPIGNAISTSRGTPKP